MGIIVDRQVNQHCKLGVWEITEDYQKLASRIRLDEQDYSTLHSFKNIKRKREWLSVRLLLNHLTNDEKKIIYNGNKKPLLSDKSFYISVSHSDEYAAVLLCKNRDVGIDIEKMQAKIQDIATKFLKNSELANINQAQPIYHLYLHWCAKESLYKLCDKKKMSLKQNITINPFMPKESGTISAKVRYKEIDRQYQLYYFSIHNYALVWCFN